MSLSVLSLFAGIGGIDLGLERTGKFQTVAYSEIDDYACRIMQQHFPNAVNIGDVTEIDWTTVQPVDVIVGGFPCQDISLAGKGAGIDGERSGLWTHYADAIRTLRPKGVLVENVAALLHRGIDRVLGDLASCGYDAEWDCIPAAAVGAPHLRDRIFIIAYRSDVEKHDSNADSTRCEKRNNASKSSRKINGDWCADGGATTTNTAHDGQTQRSTHSFRNRKSTASGDCTSADAAGQRQSGSRQPVKPGCAAPTSNRKTTHARHGGRWTVPTGSEWWRVEPDVGRVAHGVSNRMDRLRCLGNAVVPQVAEHVGRILLDRIGEA